MDHLHKTGGVFLVNSAGVEREREGENLNWNANALPVLGWQYMQEGSSVAADAGRDATETGGNE